MSKQLENADGTSAPAGNSLGVGTVWRGVRRYPRTSALFFACAVAVGAAIWFFLPLPKMTAYVVFQVSAQPPSILSPVGEARADFNLYCQAQSALIRSRPVLNRALNEPGVANVGMLRGQSDKIGWLENRLNIDFKKSPEFMRLSLEGDESEDMRMIVDAIKTVYMKEVLTKESEHRLKRLRQLEKVQQKYTESLDTYRKRLGLIAEALGSTDPASLALKEKYAWEQLGQAQRELLTLESDMRRAGVEANKVDDKVKTIDKAEVPKEVVDAAIKNDAGYQKLEAARLELVGLIDRTKAGIVAGTRPPALIEREAELEKVKKEIAEYSENIRPIVAARLKESTVYQSKQQLSGLEDRRGLWADVKKAIEKDIDKITNRLHQSNSSQLELENIRRDMGRLERTWDMVQQQIEELKPEMDAPSRVGVWEEPVVVAGIEGNRRLKYTAMAFVGFLGLGIGLITFIEARNRHVVSAKDVSEDLGMRLIGTIPPMPRLSGRDSVASAAQMELWQSVLTESVDSTRTMLVHSLTGAKAGVAITVTSAMPEEGKTMFASHIASSLARAGYKTLLVDGDMRRPSLNRLLEAPLTPGLCELLRGECAPSDAIRPCLVNGLSFLPAGVWDVRVSQTLSTERWRILKTQLASGFDYVVIDTSPLLLVTDPLLMAQHTDGTVISVLRNVSRVDNVSAARDRLTSLGVKILGVVVNGLEQHTYRPNYYHGYLRPKQAPAEAIAPPGAPAVPLS